MNMQFERIERQSIPFPAGSIPRRPPLKLAKVKQALTDIALLTLAVFFVCSGGVAVAIALAMLIFGSF